MRYEKHRARYAVLYINPERPYVPLVISQHNELADARLELKHLDLSFDSQRLCIRDRETGRAWLPTYGGWVGAQAEAQHFGYDEALPDGALVDGITRSICERLEWDKRRRF